VAGDSARVIRRGGHRWPELSTAARTRSRPSDSAVSGRPTICNPGKPRPICASCPNSPAKALNVPIPAVRKPGAVWTELPGPANAGTEPVGQVRIGYAWASTTRQSLHTQLNSLAEARVTRVFSEKISTRAPSRPELDKAVALAGELRASGVRVTLVVHEHRLDRSIELATLAEGLKVSDVGLQFLTGELQGSHDPSSIVFTILTALSGSEREYIPDRTLEGHEAARTPRQDHRRHQRHRLGHARHGPAPTRAGTEPARHRRPARHHHRKEEEPAPLPRHRHCEC
jgi:DNA invertase Pin-like site-specific DNA recombinase